LEYCGEKGTGIEKFCALKSCQEKVYGSKWSYKRPNLIGQWIVASALLNTFCLGPGFIGLGTAARGKKSNNA
jgi:hypothetical protein